eukprot:14185071-Alexandrium_andersonii.AAC.1
MNLRARRAGIFVGHVGSRRLAVGRPSPLFPLVQVADRLALGLGRSHHRAEASSRWQPGKEQQRATGNEKSNTDNKEIRIK